MANKMLIDAAHPEETRVVVLRGNRVEEFDFESASRRQLRGNIYLAKVTRVEPSLQAAFVDYGGNRHGFLAFSEIHPDYYQIPVADRQALIEAEEREIAEERAVESERERRAAKNAAADETREDASDEASDEPTRNPPARRPSTKTATTTRRRWRPTRSRRRRSASPPPTRCPNRTARTICPPRRRPRMRRWRKQAATRRRRAPPKSSRTASRCSATTASSRSAPKTRWKRCPSAASTRVRQYKIQEVIKRRQVLLVQVVKEERGNKGAALTTYLSLAGRYSVLMPNTARGGGISRKITSMADRKRLKQVVSDLEVPDGMGVILRTAGASRTRAEVKRDFEYLLRLWENVRELTLQSTRPCPGLRGRLADQALDPRPLQQGHRRDPGRRRRRLPRGQGLHAHAHAEPCQERAAVTRTASRSSRATASRRSSTRCSSRR